jgi:ATP-binding cassette subfamily B protein
LAVSGGLALAVYFAMTTNDPTLMGGLFAFLMLSQRAVQPLLDMALSINEWDEARYAIDAVAEIVNRPEEEGRSGQGVRAQLQGGYNFPMSCSDIRGRRHQL